MTHGIDLSTLSHAEKDELILSLLPLAGQLEAALARIAELEKRLAALERPAKTPDNSSIAPSKFPKPDRPAGDKPPRKSRPGVGRAPLEPNPDRIVEARLDACPHCAAAFPAERQAPRNLRPSVIFRKVTNGFRCEWGAETYAAFRSVVSTAKANRASVLAVLQFVLAARLPTKHLGEVG